VAPHDDVAGLLADVERLSDEEVARLLAADVHTQDDVD
jgi:hypothetical protein